MKNIINIKYIILVVLVLVLIYILLIYKEKFADSVTFVKYPTTFDDIEKYKEDFKTEYDKLTTGLEKKQFIQEQNFILKWLKFSSDTNITKF